MKAKTKVGTGTGRCLLFFCYEDWQGDRRFRSYQEARKVLGSEVYLESYIYNPYYNCEERVHELLLKRKPTIRQIRNFIVECRNCLSNN